MVVRFVARLKVLDGEVGQGVEGGDGMEEVRHRCWFVGFARQ